MGYLCLVAQSCPTLCDPLDCSPPGYSVHGIFQARILELVAIFHLQGNLPGFPALYADVLSTEPPGKPCGLSGWMLNASTSVKRGQAGGNLTQKSRRQCNSRAEAGGMQPQAKGYWPCQRLEEARKGLPLEPPKS